MYRINEFRRIRREEGISEALYQSKKHLIRNYRFVHYPAAIYYSAELGLSFFNSVALAKDNEKRILVDLLRNIDPDDVFFDIGAGEGTYSLKVAEVINPANIVAIEPGKKVRILESEARNRGYNDLTIINKAVSAGSDESYIVRDDDGVVVREDGVERSGSSAALQTVDAEDILTTGGVEPPTVVKVDVYGWDLDVLRAIDPIISTDECRLIYVEIEPPDARNVNHHPRLHELSSKELHEYVGQEWSFDEILCILIEAGFKVEYLTDRSDDLFIKGWKDPSRCSKL